jgi:rhamnogalacturonyl hydrolase YesR
MMTFSTTVRAAAALLLATMSTFAMAQAPEEPVANAQRFSLEADGTVRDSMTGLLWAAEDNGGDIDWPAAQSYCQTQANGWRLPTVAELLKIYDESAEQRQECIGLLTCKITPLIRVSGLTPWSGEQNGSTEAWYVYLFDGKQYAYSVSDTQGKRALCVRNP